MNRLKEHSPCIEADGLPGSQVILYILRNLKVHYCIYRSPPVSVSMIVNNELIGLWLEMVMPSFKILFSNVPEGTEEDCENLSQDCWPQPELMPRL